MGDDMKNDINSSLAVLGGGAAGGAAGLMMVNPLHVVSNLRGEKKAEQATQEFKRSRETLTVLNDLHTGRLSWDDIEDEAKPYLQELFSSNKDFLKDRQGVRQALNEQPPVQVSRMEGVPKFRMNQLLPSKRLLLNAEETMKHPAVTGLALLGGLGGHFGYQMHQEKTKEDAE